MSLIKVAINGYGRIGRNILRALYESGLRSKIQVVAINDLGDANTLVHLTRYDSTHGRFHGDVKLEGSELCVNGDRIQLLQERNPEKLPWKTAGVDVVYECTGLFTTQEKAQGHLKAGAAKVLISAPATGVDATIVFGVNHQTLRSDWTVVSNASCTTNCLAPIAQVLHRAVGIESGLMNTIHSYTNDQVLLDVYHSDLRRARSATSSMILTKTGAASAVGLVLPELNGKLDGFAIRVPTQNVSVVDFTFQASRKTTVEEVNGLLKEASLGPLKGVLACNEEPLVSIDFNHHPASSIADLTQTKVIGQLVKVLSWYDNEWGFSNRMLNVTEAWMKA